MTDSKPLNDERLSAYLDGELPAEEHASFEQLLQDRADYRQALDELRTMRTRLRALPAEKLDAGFADRVLRQAEIATLTGAGLETSPSISPKTTGGWSRSAIIAAAVTLVATFAGALLLPGYMAKSPLVAMSPSGDDAAMDTAVAVPSTATVRDVAEREEASVVAIEERISELETVPSIESEGSAIEAREDMSSLMAEADSEMMRAAPMAGRTPSQTRSTAPRGGAAATPQIDLEDSVESTPSLTLVNVEDQQLQQLARQARQLLNDVEPQLATSDRWDVVLLAELRDETDWSVLEDSLAANSMSVVSSIASSETRIQAGSTDSLDVGESQSDLNESGRGEVVDDVMTSDEPTNEEQSSFAIRQDASEFMNKLQRARSTSARREKELAKSDAMRRSNVVPDEVETHLLYVEGTQAQMDRFVAALSGSQSSAEVIIDQVTEPGYVANDRSIVRNDSSPRRRSAIRKNALESAGRAVHLGQSLVKRSMSNQQGYGSGGVGSDGLSANDQRKPVSTQQTFNQEMKSLDDDVESKNRGGDSPTANEPLVQGLIILQDFSDATSATTDTLTPDAP